MKTVPYPEECKSIPVYRDYMIATGGHVYTIEEEARIILWLAGKTQGNCVEIGCNEGMFTRALAEWYPGKRVYAVDSPYIDLVAEQEYERVKEVGKFAAHLPNVTVVSASSRSFFYPPNVTFAFIDGDHTYEGVKADTEKAMLYEPQIIAWHDYRPDSEWMGVARLLNEMVNDGVELVQVEGTPIVVKGWPA